MWIKIPNPRSESETTIGNDLSPGSELKWRVTKEREQKRMIDRQRGRSRRVSLRRESIDEKEKRRRHRRLGFWDRKRRFFSTSWWWLGRVSSSNCLCCDLRSNLERLAKPLHRFEPFFVAFGERLEISNSKLVTRTWGTTLTHVSNYTCSSDIKWVLCRKINLLTQYDFWVVCLFLWMSI